VPDRDGLREDIGSLSKEDLIWINNEFKDDGTFVQSVIEEFLEREKIITIKHLEVMKSIHYMGLEPEFDLTRVSKLGGLTENFNTVWAKPEERLVGFTFLVDRKTLQAIYNDFQLPDLSQYLIYFPEPANRKWHQCLSSLLNRNIVYCKRHWIPDSLYFLFGDHNLALPNLLSTELITAWEEQKVFWIQHPILRRLLG